MEINNLGMEQGTLRAPAWHQSFALWTYWGWVGLLFLTKGNEGNEGLFIFVLFVSFCARSSILLSFLSRFGASNLFICLMAGTIMPQVAKNEKPMVGF